MIPTGMVALLTMVMTRRMQRLGDLAAGTMVIVDERSWRLPVAKVDDPRVAALASYFPGDYRVSRSMARALAIYAERRHYLTPARRREVARHLTVPLVDLFEFRRDIDPDLLMYALYYRTFLTDASDDNPDLGPLAGYSPLRRDEHKPQGLAEDSRRGTGGGSVLTTPVTTQRRSAMQTKPAIQTKPVIETAPVIRTTPVIPTQPGRPAGADGGLNINVKPTSPKPAPPTLPPTAQPPPPKPPPKPPGDST
jgi:hypothetical protein